VKSNSHSYTYYPGCSLHSTGLEYGLSAQAVFNHLNMVVNEIPDWNCCGASSAHALDHKLSLALPARNISLAQRMGGDLIAPCAACFNRMRGTDYVLRTDETARAEIEELVSFHYTGEVNVRPLLAVFLEDFQKEELAHKVKRPLSGLKVVPYYGCLLVRPPHVTQFDDPENPKVISELLSILGADVCQWSYATDCCGAGLSLSRSDVVFHLVSNLVERAREAGAEALVTACPLCQVNLEMRQTVKPKIATFYFTELMGLAFGLSETYKWWSKHLIDPRPLLQTVGLAD
jgi:heterodisulfide reductase subunit B2